MSLFATRDWWLAPPAVLQRNNSSCLSIVNIDHTSTDSSSVVIGSLDGMLRLYAPRKQDYHVEDLLIECQLEAPVLQLTVGQLLLESNHTALAVLHPRAVVVYSIEASLGEAASEIADAKLDKAFEHSLDRPASNIIHGAFGGTYGHQLLMVQTLDGYLYIMDPDRVLLVRRLGRFLLPGPLTYSTKADMVLTYSSRMELVCYRYCSIASDDDNTTHGTTNAAQKVDPDWTLIVGEEIVSLEVGRFSRALASSSVDLLLLTSHNLIALKDSGTIRAQHRIDYVPLCSKAFLSQSRDAGAVEENVLVATRDGVVLVYRDLQLLWSARLEWPATAVQVVTVGAIAGLILSLRCDGSPCLSYLGTDPPASAVTPDTKELNYEAMDDEHRRLLQVIRDASVSSAIEPTDQVCIRAQVPNTFDHSHGGHDEPGSVCMLTVRFFVSYTGGATTLENVSVFVSCMPPLFAVIDGVVLPSLAGGNRTPTIVPLTFRARATDVPMSLTVTAIAVYSTSLGEPRCARCDFAMPLWMIAEPILPIKKYSYKITLETNRTPPLLGKLFEDLVSMQPMLVDAIHSGAVNGFSVQYHCGLDATLLVSKNAGRFRVQSSSFEGLWLLSDELVRRLIAYHTQLSQQAHEHDDFAVLYAEPLPVQEYFALVDAHLRCRADVDALTEQLAARARQMRVAQKRLLVRLKDRNPAPMQNLELLLDGTYTQLLELARTVTTMREQLELHEARVAAGTRLLLLLLRLRFALRQDDALLLQSYLSPLIIETPDQGWEERTDTAITQLLKTGLAKDKEVIKEGRTAISATVRLADATKLKKHVSLVADRLQRGVRPHSL